MRIAVYAPLKAPDHPVPSGDRLMARLMIRALGEAGHSVELMSDFRAFLPDAEAAPAAARARAAAEEAERIARHWAASGVPDAVFCYHPYYKAPDLIGPPLCRRFGIPYLTAETSYSYRRNRGAWAEAQAAVLDGIGLAAVNLAMTRRDADGIRDVAPDARIAMLAPFIDPAPFLKREPVAERGRLVTVAMMRPGDKLSSYRGLAAALALAERLDWTLDVVGDGPVRAEVEALFAPFGAGRIRWHGERPTAAIADLLAASALFVWPGHGEAYGLAYLEAAAAGVPAVAERVAGVPEVIADGRTGLLTAPGAPEAFAAAIGRLLGAPAERAAMAAGARRHAIARHSLAGAALRLQDCLEQAIGARP